MDGPANHNPYGVGFRFDPTDDTLMYYLKRKIFNERLADIIPSANVYDVKPDDLPFGSYKYGDGTAWYFFTIRPNHTVMAGNGYWSPTMEIQIRGDVPGFKKELVYYDHSRQKTNWFMHEYSVHRNVLAHAALEENDRAEALNIVICKIFRKADSSISSNGGSYKGGRGSNRKCTCF